MGVEDYSKATWTQNFIASISGAVASITIAAPLDVVKTRIQNANFEAKVSGVTVIKDLVRTEGASALFKGLTPKVSASRWVNFLDNISDPSLLQILVVGPKLVFSYTLAQSLIPYFAQYV